jgi:hypothetical protein
MYDPFNLSGLATAVLDFTDALSPLLVGLLGVMWFSAGMLIWAAAQHFRAARIRPAPRDAPAAVDRRKAA